jgi:hypothetical protein
MLEQGLVRVQGVLRPLRRSNRQDAHGAAVIGELKPGDVTHVHVGER